jgi:hypothetical protein
MINVTQKTTYYLLPLMLLFLFTGGWIDLHSQPWKFVKEKYGIKVYTGDRKNSTLKTFKGEAILHTTVSKVYSIIGSVRPTDHWDENIKELKVLLLEKDKSFSYYLIYSIPWPLHNRDLCVEAKISKDTVTGNITIISQSRPQLVPENSDLVRIRDYWQKWTIQPIDGQHLRLILEGYADPAGNIPGWLYNMVITDTPLKLIHDIALRVE